MTDELKTDPPEEAPIEDLDVAPEDAEQVKGGGTLMNACATGKHIGKGVITT